METCSPGNGTAEGAGVAPAFIVRAASWPIEVLYGFGSALETFLAAGPEAREAAYATLVERDRELLYARTSLCRSFRRALAAVNPELASRLLARDPNSARSKRVRHLETTLFRYLSRAATRMTPCGLWAGVTLGRFSTEDRIEACPVQIACVPDLAPFVRAFDALQKRQRLEGEYFINPTVRARGSAIRLRTSTARLQEFEIALPAERLLSVLTDAGATQLRGHAAALCAAFPALTIRDAVRLVERLEDYQVLIGTTAFPTRFGDAWEALEQASQALGEAAQMAWRGAVAALRQLCDHVCRDFEALDAEEMLAATGRARAVLGELSEALGVQLEVPRSPLRIDMRHGYEVLLGADSQRSLVEAVGYYWAHQRSCAPGPALLQVSRAVLADVIERGATVRDLLVAPTPLAVDQSTTTWEQLARALSKPAALQVRLEAMSRLLSAGSTLLAAGPPERRDEPDVTPPLCGFMVGIAFELGEMPRVRAVTSQTPCPFTWYSRFASLLEPALDEHSILFNWLRGHFDRVPNACGAVAVELVCPGYGEPNTLTRPEFGLPVLDIWRPANSSIPVDQISFDGVGFKLGERPLAAFFFPSANVFDMGLEALAITTGQPLRALCIDTGELPYEVEVRQGGSPRLELPNGAVIRPERQLVAPHSIEKLLGLRQKHERFLCWLEMAQQHAWPELIRVRAPGRPSLVIPTRSALALEALLEGWQREVGGTFIVESLDTLSFVQHEDGQHYATEFVIFAEESGSRWYSRAA